MKRLLTLLLAVPLSLCFTGCAAAATLYVDPDSVGGTCRDTRAVSDVTIAKPWCSLSVAFARAPASSVVRLRRGQHAFVSTKDVRRTLTFAAYGTERPVVAGLRLDDSRGLRFQHLRFTGTVTLYRPEQMVFHDNQHFLTPGGRWATPSGYVVYAGSGLRFTGNWVRDGRDGVNLRPLSSRGVQDVVVHGNRFQRLGNDGVNVGAFAQRVRIERNVFIDSGVREDIDPDAHPDSTQISGPTRYVSWLANRVIRSRGLLAGIRTSDAVTPPDEANIGLQVRDNVVAGYGIGIRLYSSPAARVLGNTVYNNSESPFSGLVLRGRADPADSDSPNLDLRRNVLRRLDVETGTSFAYRLDNLVAAGEIVPGEVRGVAQFVDPARGDYRLTASSPGQGWGAPTSVGQPTRWELEQSGL